MIGWWTDHDERLTRYCHWVEDVEVVLPVMVASKMVDRGCRSGRRKVTCGLLLLLGLFCLCITRDPSWVVGVEGRIPVMTRWCKVVEWWLLEERERRRVLWF